MFRNTCKVAVTRVARKVLPARLRHVLRHWVSGTPAASYGYEIIKSETLPELVYGWRHPEVAKRQHAAFVPLLRQMYEGNPREDFVAMATAVRMTGLENPLIIEVGCGSGWNLEVLNYLLKQPVRYMGVDYSLAMVALGRERYHETTFVVGDATELPFHDGACDVLLSGTVLMHVVNYRQAIHECRRTASRWCIFHGVPVVLKRSTAILRKFAYGRLVPEIIFNEQELLELIYLNGMKVRQVLESFSYDLRYLLNEATFNRTYVCEVA